MRALNITVALLFLSFTSQAGEAEIEKLKGCYEALIGKSTGASFSLGNRDYVLVPSKRNGKNGFYLYTDRNAYFQSLGAVQGRRAEPPQYEYRYLKVAAEAGKRPIYLTYSVHEGSYEKPSISSSSRPAEPLKGKYRTLKGGDALDNESYNALVGELKKRVATVVEHFTRTLEASSNKSGSPPKKDKYNEALDTCKKAGDTGLRKAVVEAESKLQPLDVVAGGSQQSGGAEGSGAREAR